MLSKSKKIALGLLTLLFVTSCKNNVDDSSIKVSDDVSISEEETIIQSSKWGEQYNEIIIDNLSTDIPYIECPQFEVVEGVDDYGDPLIQIYLFYQEEILQDKLREYAIICENEGYMVELQTVRVPDPNSPYSTIIYDVYFADLIISPILGIELQFLEGNYKGRECMGIFAYNYPVYDENNWPSGIIEYALGNDVEHIDGEYTYYASLEIDSNGELYVYIVVSYVEDSYEQTYLSLLEEKGYIIYDQEYDEYGYMCLSPDGKHVIQFKQTYNEVEIMVYNYN